MFFTYIYTICPWCVATWKKEKILAFAYGILYIAQFYGEFVDVLVVDWVVIVIVNELQNEAVWVPMAKLACRALLQ